MWQEPRFPCANHELPLQPQQDPIAEDGAKHSRHDTKDRDQPKRTGWRRDRNEKPNECTDECTDQTFPPPSGTPVQHILPTQLFDSVHAWFTLPFVQAGMRTGWLPNVEFLEGLDRLHHTLAGPLEQ